MQDLPCFCINLDERPEKWAATEAAFQNTGIVPKRFPAIRHREGWRGCGASHVAVAREALRRGLPWILVIEDDCLPVKDFTERWPVVKEALWKERGSWDIFLGGPTSVEGPIDTIGKHLIQIDTGYALHFYVLHATAYERALGWNPDRHGPIDVYYSNEFRMVTTTPLLAIQRPSESDIQGFSTDYTELFVESMNKIDKLSYSLRTRNGSIGIFIVSCIILVGIWFKKL